MLRAVLLLLAVVGLHARPLQDVTGIRKSGWEIKGPELVQDVHKEDSVRWITREHSRHSRPMSMNTGVKHEHHKSTLVELHRQGTEPSRRFLMDLNTGMLKENVGEMNRRVAGFYNPSAHEVRQGTQNSRASLVDVRTGQLYPLSEMQRRADPSKGEVDSGPYHKEGQDTSGQEKNHKPVPVELRRQGTEPSRRFLMDLNTGMLKENVGEMNRRVAGFYNPSADEVRQGTQNSRASLVDVRTGQLLYPLSEMQRSAAAHEGSNELHRQETEPSRNLMDLNAGQLKGHRNTIDSKATGSKWEVVSGPGQRPDTSRHEENHNSDAVEFHRQGTEPSRRFLMDLNTGMLKENVGEMNRRVAGFYNPSAHEVRQGTQNSRASLVDVRTGQLLYPLSEMQRSAAAHEGSNELHRQETEPSRNLMDLNAGQLKGHRNTIDSKATGSKWEVVSGPDQRPDTSRHEENHNSDAVEFHRQGTEPSRRFLMDLNTGMLKENVGEMNRRVAGFYNPSAHEVRQGTQNSRASLVDVRTGQLLYPLSEMQRRADPSVTWEVKSGPAHDEKKSQHSSGHENHKPVPVELRRQGTEPSRRFLMDLNTGMLKENVGEMNRRVAGFYNPSAHEVRQGTQNSRASLVDVRTGQLLYPLSEMQRRADPLKESRPYILKDAGEAGAVCHGEIIQGRCYSFNSTPQTFNEAEVSCKTLSPEGHVASVANADVHKQLVAMVTKAKNHPVLMWLGGIQKENQFHWIDGSSWGYSDWMPGHPQKHKLSCLEMFRFDESWWTAVDCGQRRAFICSHPMTA